MRKSNYIVIYITILFIAICLPSTPISQAQDRMPAKVILHGMDQSEAREIESLVSREMARRHSPGLGVGVVRGDTLVFAGYFGWANIAKREAVSESTLFRIGSISKTVTAIGLMQQYEKGKFSLDDDINNYLPRSLVFPPHPDTKPVTFRHLLTHTSGGGEFLSYRQIVMPGFGVVVRGENYQPLENYLKFGMRTRIDPGQDWAYCNYGFAFLGLALEKIAGEQFHEYMKRHVLDVLGMNETAYHHDQRVLSHTAAGYKYKHGGFVEDPHKPTGITPAGSIYTNISDMGRYVIALLNGGRNAAGQCIKPETLDMMMKTQYTLDERQRGWGLGFEVYSNNRWGRRIVGHSGSIPWGFTSQMLLVPGEKVGVYVFSNSMTYSPREIAWGVLKDVLDAHDEPLPKIPSQRDVWKKLVGYYGPRHRKLKSNMRLYMEGIGAYRVTIVGDQLKLIYLWKGKRKEMTLEQVSPGDSYFYRIMVEDRILPEYIAFKRDKSGNIISIIPGGLNEYVRLGAVRRVNAKAVAVPGKILNRISPF